MEIVNQILAILGSLGLFFYAMKMMSEAIQKLAGDRLRASLNLMTRNRFGGVFTGFFVTSIIQSSSATTVMVVSFVNAGLLTLTESIGVIMGANLGTTVTIWIVSFLGFKMKLSALTLPIIAVGMPMIFSKKGKYESFGEFLIGFALLFMGLSLLKNAVPDIKNHPEFLEFMSEYTDLGYGSFLIFIFFGVILTVVVQSSSAAGAITVTMAYKGWIDFPTAAAIVLGENIGTTITAYLASLTTNTISKQAARAHFLFNVIGVLWMLVVFQPFLYVIDMLVPGSTSDPKNIPLHLSAFHTLFNFTNICLLVSFVPQIAKIVERMVKPQKEDLELREYKLEYMSTGMTRTPQMNLLESRKEAVRMAQLVREMFDQVLELLFDPDKAVEEKMKLLQKKEILTDQMEVEITRYLLQCSREATDTRSSLIIQSRMRTVDELESIADCCYKLGLSAERAHQKKITFHDSATEEIRAFADQLIEFLDFNHNSIEKAQFTKGDLDKAFSFEGNINEKRNTLKKNSIERLSNQGDVQAEILYMDIIKNFEHIGDHSLNISQALGSVYAS